jgi:3-deoxy-manno-octulosonate cytidylyltransferase (CMP-KDO synthetase)
VNHAGANPPNNPQHNVIAIIPARFGSTRLPGKALLDLGGKPMIVRVVDRARASQKIDRVIVATDDERIREAVIAFGHEAVITQTDHATGTDRLAEVAATLDAELIVNVQGDEPLISAETIDRAVAALESDFDSDVATAWEPIETAEDILDPNVVKVVLDEKCRALYFSRAPIPFPRIAVQKYGSVEAALEHQTELIATFKKHTGLYVYRRELLLSFAKWPATELERQEGLEQLRALERGVRIRVVESAAPSIGVDTQSDLDRVRELISRQPAAVA